MLVNDENTKGAVNRVGGNNGSHAKGGGGKSKSKTIEETYTKKSQLEHILLRPDTYVGSVEKQTQPMWVLDAETKQVVSRPISYVPGLYKIFDEIVVNAADNKQRDASMNRIEVTINPEEGSIRVWNNGNGIPIAVHQEHGIYVPELIFGNLLTGSNFDDNEQKTTGGRNGFGAKLANIFSTRFIVETTDSSRNLKYRQEFTDNMTQRHDPVVQKSTGTDCTCITFYPDLERFKMDYLDEDIVALLSKRVYDIAGTNSSGSNIAGGKGGKLNVYLNGSRLEVKNFEQYVSLYQGIEPPVALERVNDRWEIGVGVSDGSFQQISFVNSICTTKGGCHVNYIADQITSRLMPVVKKKNKGEEVKAHQIKNHLAIFVNALVVNPAFDSQTKENLTTKASSFGSICTVTDKMMKQIEKSGIIDNILNWAKFKQTAELKKKSGSKRSKLIGITKLDDANHAGTAKSSQCTLILTEGDSAKALAISGLGVVGRDYYGVFPLKGKLLNVREASHQQIMKNEEVQNITKIIGLTFGKVYSDTSSLRYGHLMIMTDQDHDGSHIKGLLINFIHHFWPSLLQLPGFLQQFITPIVKCTKGKRELSFFTIPEYQNWREEQQQPSAAGGLKGWRIKYYKGLGTSTAAEAKDYFSNLRTHELDFCWDDRAADMIDMAFAKKRVEDRKLWLLSKESGVHIDYNVDKISYDNFINQELILFSYADNERSIPHFMDGLKPSQRKVLFSCFKRNLKQEIKVAQLAGYISEHSAYHHGEASLTQTIIGMAQNFVGSNNINLLSPCGQFGTRLMGGKDAASPRYVFTKLENIARHIFHPHDDPLLEYLDDDGQSIEPVHYLPIIPMALVNGGEGIGTGWSSSVPTYNPRDIIGLLRRMIQGELPASDLAASGIVLEPWYRGFSGTIEPKVGKDCNNFSVHGALAMEDENTVIISELPVGKWTTDYKQFLESLVIGAVPAAAAASGGNDGAAAGQPFIKDFKENHTDTSVLFTVSCLPGKLAEFSALPGGLYKKFKLDGSIATSNMHLFDLNSQIKKFEGPLNLVEEYFGVRMMYYDRRKVNLADKLTEEWEKLDNKMRFVLAVIKNELVVSNRKKSDLMSDLQERGFKAFYEKKSSGSGSNVTGDQQSEDNADSEDADDGNTGSSSSASSKSLDKGYDYLLSMKIWSLTMEKVQELINQRNTKKGELELLLSKPAEQLWMEDLDALEVSLCEFEGALDEEQRQEAAAMKKAARSGGKQSSKQSQKSRKPMKQAKKSRADSEGESSSDDDEVDGDDDSDFEEKKPQRQIKKPAAKPAVVKSRTVVPPPKATATTAVAKPAAAAQKQSTLQSWTAPKESGATTSAAALKATAPVAAKAADEYEGMSLFDRLRLKKETAAKPDPLSVTATTTARAAPKSKAFAASALAAIDLCENVDENKAAAVAATTSRPGRAAAIAALKKTSAALESDEEDEVDFDFTIEDSDSELRPAAAAKKKPTAARAKKPTASAPTTAAAAASGRIPLGVLSSPPSKTAGQKRATKSGFGGSRADTFSPGICSPDVANPEKRVKSAAVVGKGKSTYATGAGPAKRAAVAKGARGGTSAATSDSLIAPAVKKSAVAAVKRTNRKIIDDDEEEEGEFDDANDAVEVPTKSPKPVRARKTLNYRELEATADSDEEDEEESDEEEEDDGDDSDFGDSD